MPRGGAATWQKPALDGELSTSSQGASGGAGLSQQGAASIAQDTFNGAGRKASFGSAGAVREASVPPFRVPHPKSLAQHSWLPSRSTFVFFLVALHLGALCYWCYLMYLSHRRAKAAAAARGETRMPPPKVNCTYDWSSMGEADPESKGFFSRFRFKPLLEKKDSGRPILRSELATMGILGTGMPSRPRITRTPTLPSTPELV